MENKTKKKKFNLLEKIRQMTPTMYCKECSRQVNANLATCPYCGKSLSSYIVGAHR